MRVIKESGRCCAGVLTFEEDILVVSCSFVVLIVVELVQLGRMEMSSNCTPREASAQEK
jgi:hypothetical protein